MGDERSMTREMYRSKNRLPSHENRLDRPPEFRKYVSFTKQPVKADCVSSGPVICVRNQRLYAYVRLSITLLTTVTGLTSLIRPVSNKRDQFADRTRGRMNSGPGADNDGRARPADRPATETFDRRPLITVRSPGRKGSGTAGRAFCLTAVAAAVFREKGPR